MQRNTLGGTRRDVTTLSAWRYIAEYLDLECLLKCMFSSYIMWVHFMVLNELVSLHITLSVVYIDMPPDTASGSKEPRVTDGRHYLCGCVWDTFPEAFFGFSFIWKPTPSGKLPPFLLSPLEDRGIFLSACPAVSSVLGISPSFFSFALFWTLFTHLLDLCL